MIINNTITIIIIMVTNITMKTASLGLLEVLVVW